MGDTVGGSAPEETAQTSTVVGVATGRPDGGVAVVRLSGPRAFEIGTRLAGPLPPARELGFRRLKLASGLEDALVVSMPGPGSYTGEDVVELHVHAGALNVGEVVEATLAAGAVAAEAGEFTRRAFAHGRLGLDQAEGIAAVIGARTREALSQARRLVAGELGREVEQLRQRVADLRAEIEANLDFPDDVGAQDRARWRMEVTELEATAGRWLAGFEAGRRRRERARVVLAGPPNAGKSSLFNALLGHARALVAATPGTTRDYVEAEVEIDGRAALLVDTAGLREKASGVERAGVARTTEQVAGADLVLWVESADTEPGAEAGAELEGAAVIRVESKRDLGLRRPQWVGVASERNDVAALREALVAWFGAGRHEAWIGLARHRDRVRDASEALARTSALLEESGLRLELVAFELGVTQGRLGEITGRHALGATGADVLDAIFSKFCIGK